MNTRKTGRFGERALWYDEAQIVAESAHIARVTLVNLVVEQGPGDVAVGVEAMVRALRSATPAALSLAERSWPGAIFARAHLLTTNPRGFPRGVAIFLAAGDDADVPVQVRLARARAECLARRSLVPLDWMLTRFTPMAERPLVERAWDETVDALQATGTEGGIPEALVLEVAARARAGRPWSQVHAGGALVLQFGRIEGELLALLAAVHETHHPSFLPGDPR